MRENSQKTKIRTRDKKNSITSGEIGKPFQVAYIIGHEWDGIAHTAISRKVVGKKVHATIPKGNMGYDQYTVSNTVAVEPTFAASL